MSTVPCFRVPLALSPGIGAHDSPPFGSADHLTTADEMNVSIFFRRSCRTVVVWSNWVEWESNSVKLKSNHSCNHRVMSTCEREQNVRRQTDRMPVMRVCADG